MANDYLLLGKRIYTKIKLLMNIIYHRIKIYKISKKLSVKVNFLDIFNYNSYLLNKNIILDSENISSNILTNYIIKNKYHFNILSLKDSDNNNYELTESNKAMMILNLLVSSNYNKEKFYINYRNKKFYYKPFDSKRIFDDIDKIIRESKYFD